MEVSHEEESKNTEISGVVRHNSEERMRLKQEALLKCLNREEIQQTIQTLDDYSIYPLDALNDSSALKPVDFKHKSRQEDRVDVSRI